MKTTLLLSKKIERVIIICLLLGSIAINNAMGQEQLFRFKVNDTYTYAVDPTTNLYSLNVSDITINGLTHSYTLGNTVTTKTAGYINTQGWGTSLDIPNKSFSISISNSNANIGFVITKMDIYVTHEDNPSDVDFALNFGSETRIATETKTLNGLTTYSLSDINKLIPPVKNSDVQTFYIGTTTTADTKTVFIDRIDVFGIKIDIPTYTNEILWEDFDAYYSLSLGSAPTVQDFNAIDITSGTQTAGWTGANLYAFYVPNYRISNLLLGGTATDSAYIKTPSIDLSGSYEIKFETRSRVGAASNNGVLNISDNSGLLWTGTNTATTFTTITTGGFISSATENITFAVPKTDGSEQVIENIVIKPSTQPALSYGILTNKALGTAKFSTSKAFTIPLKAANLTGDVTLTLKDSTNFILPDGGTITQATAETGTDLNITFIAPETLGTYTDTLTISATGTTDRLVVLSATSDLGTATTNLTDGALVVTGNQLTINGHAGKKASIYNLSGATLFVQANISDNAVFTLPAKGVYLLKIEGNNSFPATTKVVIR